VKLILNDYSFEGEWVTDKQNGVFRLLDYLIKNGAPVDGVGIQCHEVIYNIDSYINSIGTTIDKIATRINPVSGKKLIVQITEMDISLFKWDDSSLTLPASEINTRLQSQAYMYRGLFDVFNKKYNEGKLEMVLLWGVYDGGSWKNDIPIEGRTDHPLLFDRQFQPKPAFNSLITGPGNR
jgi:endo-1,4-beta-xylanase